MIAILKNARGQLSIFLAISVVFFITAVAFVINVGLFVKAKINLQNAVDAAAWSGAAVQARQLSDIAYLNWEMRNVYKEWMFKYYVLGNLSTPQVADQNAPTNNGYGGSDGMDFSLPSPTTNKKDLANIPSVCIQLGRDQSRNPPRYCSIYYSPGIPRLNNQFSGNSALTSFTKDMVDSIANARADACVNTSRLNFIVASNWAYGMGSDSLGDAAISQIPNVALDRPGAFPKAIELSMRVRNLEAIVNEPAQEEVCYNNCSNNITTLEGQGRVQNERVVKAFYSAYRNLGGKLNTELKDNFKLTEIGPREVMSEGVDDLSNLFVPEAYRRKYYLDLKLTPINVATFYTLLAPKNNTDEQTDAECVMTRIALPVPGYPFGFEKNPDVLTYYAVKGETTFNGLFNPFKRSIKLTAYSMAKPFGGRIGPRLFSTVNENYVTPRPSQGTLSYRSSPYIFGLTPAPSVGNEVPPLLPSEESFWVQNQNEAIGGTRGADEIKYVVPNLHYDPSEGEKLYHDQNIFVMPIPFSGTPYNVGVYRKDQFRRFRSNLTNDLGGLTPGVIGEAIQKVRYPTPYEAKNYLIPSSSEVNNSLQLDSFGIPGNEMNIFAPLYGENYIYKSAQEVINQITNYIEIQKPSIAKYSQTMANTAEKLRNQLSANGQAESLVSSAANKIYDEPLTCRSITGGFLYYYMGAESGVEEVEACPEPFIKAIETYFSEGSGLINSDFYIDKGMNIQEPPQEAEIDYRKFFSAYYPGPLTGGSGDEQGTVPNPFNQALTNFSLRNFYSTKFISFKNFLGVYDQGLNYSEGRTRSNFTGTQIKNPLPPTIPVNEISQ